MRQRSQVPSGPRAWRHPSCKLATAALSAQEHRRASVSRKGGGKHDSYSAKGASVAGVVPVAVLRCGCDLPTPLRHALRQKSWRLSRGRAAAKAGFRSTLRRLVFTRLGFSRVSGLRCPVFSRLGVGVSSLRCLFLYFWSLGFRAFDAYFCTFRV